MTLPYIFDKRFKRWGLFLSDLPDVNWIEYVRHLEERAITLETSIGKIKQAAIEYGANDEVAEAIAHADLIVRQKETTSE